MGNRPKILRYIRSGDPLHKLKVVMGQLDGVAGVRGLRYDRRESKEFAIGDPSIFSGWIYFTHDKLGWSGLALLFHLIAEGRENGKGIGHLFPDVSDIESQKPFSPNRFCFMFYGTLPPSELVNLLEPYLLGKPNSRQTNAEEK